MRSTYKHIMADFDNQPTEEDINAYGDEGWCLRAVVAVPKTVDTGTHFKGKIDYWIAYFSKHVWVDDGKSGITL